MGLVKLLLVAGRWSLAAAWRWLRDVTEDSAYERYLARLGKVPKSGRGASHPPSPAAFYLARLEHKYSRPTRCC